MRIRVLFYVAAIDGKWLDNAISFWTGLFPCNWGIFGFLQPFNTQDEKKWYCSEICAWFLFMARVLDKREKRISPRRLSKKLIKKWNKKPNNVI